MPAVEPQHSEEKEDIVAFDDFDSRRAMVFDSVAEAARNRFPIANERHSLELEEVGYDDADKPYTLKEQKAAILGGGTLFKKLKGRFILRDVVSGQVLERGGRRVIAKVPYMTPRGTFIRNGNESVMMNQLRMRPGVYSRRTKDGEMEALVNVKQGTGTQFKMRFHPDTALFSIKAGGRKFAAYPVLKSLGVDDDTLRAAWGDDIFNKNAAVKDARALHAAESVFVKNKGVEPATQENENDEAAGIA